MRLIVCYSLDASSVFPACMRSWRGESRLTWSGIARLLEDRGGLSPLAHRPDKLQQLVKNLLPGVGEDPEPDAGPIFRPQPHDFPGAILVRP